MTRLNAKPDTAPPQPTTSLGDWCANLVHFGRQQLVLAVSDRTFLPIVVAAAPGTTLVPRLRAALAELLEALCVPRAAIEREAKPMEDWAYGKTRNRQALGVLVDFAKTLPYYMEDGGSLLSVALKLSDTPCSPLYKTSTFPDRATSLLFRDVN
jgi:hypothetical protein